MEVLLLSLLQSIITSGETNSLKGRRTPASFRAVLWSSFYTLGIASGVKPIVGSVKDPACCSLSRHWGNHTFLLLNSKQVLQGRWYGRWSPCSTQIRRPCVDCKRIKLDPGSALTSLSSPGGNREVAVFAQSQEALLPSNCTGIHREFQGKAK